MDYTLSFSLEQDFALKVLAIQIEKINDVNDLRNNLLDLFRKTWDVQQEMKGFMNEVEVNQEDLDLEFKVRLASYTNLIGIISNVEDLRELAIEAHKMLMVQGNYADILRQDSSVPVWVKFGY